jgi:hypothetical protein
MKKMAKVSRFLKEHAWLPKTCIWLLLILWAARGYSLILWIDKDRREKATWNEEVETRAQGYLDNLGDQIAKQAEKLGTTYGPKKYWNDLVWLEGYRLWLNKEMSTHVARATEGIMHAHKILEGNERSGIYATDEIFKQRSVYEEWSNRYDPEIIRSNKTTDDDLLRWLYAWLLNCYQRGFFLVMLLYICRMLQGKGVLETILAGKMKFVYSLFLWPFFLNKYPHNVIRAVIVEAELRRMGNVFRRMTLRDKKLIWHVANSSEYEAWLAEYRKLNGAKYRRGLLTAVVVVLFLQISMPCMIVSSAIDAGIRAGPTVVVLDCSRAHENVKNSCDAGDCPCVFQLPAGVDPPLAEKTRYPVVERRWHKMFQMTIDHVPIFGCLVYLEV